MAYDILSDDILDDSSDDNKKSKKKFKISPIYFHIALILLLLLIILIFFVSDISFTDDPNAKKEISLIGELSNFSIEYKGDLDVFSREYLLTTRAGVFDGNSKNFIIENFSGTINLENNSLVFRGLSERILFDRNTLNVENAPFTLVSRKKTTLQLELEDLNLSFEEGRFRLEDELNYEFRETQVFLDNFNTSITYDGTFSFNGNVDELLLTNTRENVEISYKDEPQPTSTK